MGERVRAGRGRDEKRGRQYFHIISDYETFDMYL